MEETILGRHAGRLLALSAAFIIGTAPTALAGFASKKRGVTKIPIGGQNATKAGYEKAKAAGQLPYAPLEDSNSAPDPSVLGMIEPFSSLPANQRHARLFEIRLSILCAIELVGKENPKFEAGLREMWRRGALCFGLQNGKKKFGGIKTKGNKGFGKAKINLGKFPLDPGSTAIYCEDTAKLVARLGHWACQIDASTSEIDKKLKGTDRDKARFKDECAIVNAFTKELAWLNKYVAILDGITIDLKVDPTARGFGACLGRELIKDPTLDDNGKRAKARTVRKAVRGRAKTVAGLLKKHQNTKNSLEKRVSLGPVTPTDTYHASLNGSGFLAESFTIANGNEVVISSGGEFADGGEGDFVPTNMIEITLFTDNDVDPAPTHISVPELTTLTGFAFDDANDALYVSGYGPGSGAIYAYLDDNGDGLIDSTPVSIASGAAFASGALLGIPPNPSPGELVIINLADGGIHHAVDMNPGGGDFRVPDTITPIGSLGPSDIPVRDFVLSDDRLTITGTDGSDGLILPGYRWPQASRITFDNLFEPTALYSPFAEAEFAPAITQTVVPGSSAISICGQANTEYQLHAIDGEGNREPLSSCSTSELGSGRFNIETAWGDNTEQVEVFIIGEEPYVEVKQWFWQPRITEMRLDAYESAGSDDRFWVIAEGPTNVEFEFEVTDTTDTLSQWEAILGSRSEIGSDGSASMSFPITSADTFVRAIPIVPLIPPGSPITVEVVPGEPTLIDFVDLIGLPPGLIHEITEAPPEYTGTFCAHGEGSVTLNVPSFSGRYEFTYSVATEGGVAVGFRISVQPISRDSLKNLIPIPNFWGGPPVVAVPVLLLDDGLCYPKYQFVHGNSGTDFNCLFPHWHSQGTVYPLELPLFGRPDPHGDSCGFGLIWPFYNPFEAPTVPEGFKLWDDGAFEFFKNLNP